MLTAITVFADSVPFPIPYLGYRHIAAVATHPAQLEGIDYGYEFPDYDESGTQVSGGPDLSHRLRPQIIS